MLGKMKVRLGALLSARALAVAAAPPGIIPIFPIRNSTEPTPTTTDASCENRCSVQYPQLTAVQWVPESEVVYTEKVVVATISTIYIVSSNRTVASRTETAYGYVPPKYSAYPYSLGTNSEGTRVITVPILQSSSTAWVPLTYPTPYIDYYTEYYWQGILHTHDKAFNPACATSLPDLANVPLQLHPEYPQPKELSPGKLDQWGQESVPLWVPVKDEPDKLFFDVAFPSESAFSYCESIPLGAPKPTIYSIPKFITTSTTVYTSASTEGLVHMESTATGFEEPWTSEKCCRFTPGIPHLESTAAGFFSDEPFTSTPSVGSSITRSPRPEAPHIESTVIGLEPVTSGVAHLESTVPGLIPGASQQPAPTRGFVAPIPHIPDIIVSIINNNPGIFSSGIQAQQATRTPTYPGGVATPNPGPGPVQVQAITPTPIFTLLPTVVNGQSTTIPAYILPDSSSTATIGQTVTINGQPTVLAVPPAVFTTISTTINGIATVIPAYIISGTTTATLGQTITLNGQPTVLAVPSPSLGWISTEMNGTPTSVLVYFFGSTTSGAIDPFLATTAALQAPASTANVDASGDRGGSNTAFVSSQTTGAGGSQQGSGPRGRSSLRWSFFIVSLSIAFVACL